MRRLFLLTCLLAFAVGAATSPSSKAADASTPVLRISDGDLVWNDVKVGDTSTKTLTVSNAGGGTLPLGAPAVTGGDAADFSITGGNCPSARLTAGQTCSISVQFKPTKSSTRVSHLRVPTTIAGCVSYATLAGSGAATTSGAHPDKHGGFSTTCDTPAATTPGGGTTTTPPGSTTTTTTNISNGGVLGNTSSGSSICRSKRKIRIHIRAPKSRAFKAGTMTVKTKGRTFKAKRIKKGKRKGQYYSNLSFNGLKVGRYKVNIRATLTNGKTFKRSRYFVTCISGKTPKS